MTLLTQWGREGKNSDEKCVALDVIKPTLLTLLSLL